MMEVSKMLVIWFLLQKTRCCGGALEDARPINWIYEVEDRMKGKIFFLLPRSILLNEDFGREQVL